MKNNYLILTIILSSLLISCTSKYCNKAVQFDRTFIVDSMAKVLNIINNRNNNNEKGFKGYDRNGFIKTFDVIDLYDTLNRETFEKTKKIKFYQNRPYLFYPGIHYYNYSGILFIVNDKIKIFHSINCEQENSSSIEEIINFIQDSIPRCENKDLMLKNVKNYRDIPVYYFEYSSDGHIKLNCD
jgi:hypothetical protein